MPRCTPGRPAWPNTANHNYRVQPYCVISKQREWWRSRAIGGMPGVAHCGRRDARAAEEPEKIIPFADECLVGRDHMTNVEPDVGLVTPTDTTTTTTLPDLPPIRGARATERTKSPRRVPLAIAHSPPFDRPAVRVRGCSGNFPCACVLAPRRALLRSGHGVDVMPQDAALIWDSDPMRPCYTCSGIMHV